MPRQYLIDLRKQRNESQQDVATAIGMSRQYYSLIEDGSRQKKMDIYLATLLSAHFAIPICEIIDYESGLDLENAAPDTRPGAESVRVG